MEKQLPCIRKHVSGNGNRYKYTLMWLSTLLEETVSRCDMTSVLLDSLTELFEYKKRNENVTVLMLRFKHYYTQCWKLI